MGGLVKQLFYQLVLLGGQFVCVFKMPPAPKRGGKPRSSVV